MTQIWGHRGASAHAPENTLPAFALALGQGVDGIECDVHLTRDDEVVVIHDLLVDRTTDGHGLVGDFVLPDLRALDASAGRPGFQGTKVPLLSEVLELVADSGAICNIEIKTDKHQYRGIVERVLEVVEASGASDRVIFSSFNHYTLRRLGKLGAPQPIGALVTDRLYEPWNYLLTLDAYALHPDHRRVNRKLMANCHANGQAVHVWTVNKPKDVTRMLRLGVDAIITDFPGEVVHRRDEFVRAAAAAALEAATASPAPATASVGARRSTVSHGAAKPAALVP